MISIIININYIGFLPRNAVIGSIVFLIPTFIGVLGLKSIHSASVCVSYSVYINSPGCIGNISFLAFMPNLFSK